MAKVLLKTILFTLLVPGSVAVWFPMWLARTAWGARTFDASGLAPAAWCSIGLGSLIYAWCAYDFSFAGRGTPFPLDPPREFVSRGLYRHTRNPMYWGVGLVLLGQALLHGSPLLLGYAVLVVLVWHLFVVLHEEPTLRRKFRVPYERYCVAVPRWRWRMRPLDPAGSGCPPGPKGAD